MIANTSVGPCNELFRLVLQYLIQDSAIIIKNILLAKDLEIDPKVKKIFGEQQVFLCRVNCPVSGHDICVSILCRHLTNNFVKFYPVYCCTN